MWLAWLLGVVVFVAFALFLLGSSKQARKQAEREQIKETGE